MDVKHSFTGIYPYHKVPDRKNSGHQQNLKHWKVSNAIICSTLTLLLRCLIKITREIYESGINFFGKIYFVTFVHTILVLLTFYTTRACISFAQIGRHCTIASFCSSNTSTTEFWAFPFCFAFSFIFISLFCWSCSLKKIL